MILALFKLLGGLVLLFFIIVILFALGIFNKLRGKGGGFYTGGGSRPMFGGGAGFGGARNVEQCPSCRQAIVVGKQPGSCPKCGTPLGRSQDGRLLIRVN